MMLGLALAWAAILAGCWLGWQLLRQNGRILLRLDELGKRLDGLEFGGAEEPQGLLVGSVAPDFELPDLAGDAKSLAQFRGQSVLLIFFNPECGFCREMMPRLGAFYGVLRQAERDAALGAAARTAAPVQSAVAAGALQNNRAPSSAGLPPHVIIITTGDAEINRQLFQEHRFTCTVLLQKEMEVATAYQAKGTPSGYLVSPEGKVASELAIGGDALLALASRQRSQPSTLNPQPAVSGNGDGREGRFGSRSLAHSKIKRDGLAAGTPAPEFRLPRLDGRGDLTLSEFRGSRVLLVFSSPQCGPCAALAPRLEKFHRAHPDLPVVMISKGDPGENRAKMKEHGLTFPIVLQRQWEISSRYAMFATPIAYLIDEAGVIRRDVAVGIDAVLELAAQNNGFADRANPADPRPPAQQLSGLDLAAPALVNHSQE